MFPDSYLLSEGFSLAGKPVAAVGKAEANNPFMKVTQSQQGLAKKKQTNKHIALVCNYHVETSSHLGKEMHKIPSSNLEVSHLERNEDNNNTYLIE